MRDLNLVIRMAIILLFFFCLSVFLLINISPLLYWLAIKWFNLLPKTHLSQISLMRCYLSMLNYLQNPWESHLRLLYFYSSVRGLRHFLDVKDLFLVNNFGILIFGPLSVYILNEADIKCELWRLLIPLKMSLITLVIVFSIIMVDFQMTFIWFHRILFRNRDWVFYLNSDPVILALPLSFFVLCFIMGCLIYCSLVLICIYLIYQRIDALSYFSELN